MRRRNATTKPRRTWLGSARLTGSIHTFVSDFVKTSQYYSAYPGPRRASTHCDDLLSVPNWNICTPLSNWGDRLVSQWTVLDEPRDQKRAHSSMSHRPTAEGMADGRTRTQHRSTYCFLRADP